MVSNLNLTKKLSCVIVLNSIIFSLILFNGTMDPFVPKHILVIFNLSEQGHLAETYLTLQIPCFYVFGSIITLITSISAEELIYYPIQLLPLVFLTFCFSYKLSKSYVISSFFVLINLVQGTTGTFKIFFWPHGIGVLMFYIILLLLLNILANRFFLESIILILITGSFLVFISYDFFIIVILILFFLLVLVLSQLLLAHKGTTPSLFNHLLNILIILVVVELGLSSIVYKIFIPLISDSGFIELSGMDKFLLSYFSSMQSDTSLSHLVLTYPLSITILNLIKYGLLLVSISIFMLLFLSRFNGKHEEPLDLLLCSVVAYSFFYGLMRMSIGGMGISQLYMPGIFSVFYFYRFRGIYKYWSVFVICIILLIIPINYYVYIHNDLLDKTDNIYSYIASPANWYQDNLLLEESCIKSDELTKNFLRFYSPYNVSYNMDLLSLADVLFLTNGQPIPTVKEYFVINYELNLISIGNWVVIKSWSRFKGLIDTNVKLNKAYDISNIAIYSSN